LYGFGAAESKSATGLTPG